ncbi:hypothetical protein R54767_02268 [Paraburkholderia gardini]|uniref:Uncharacterized protein n=1 Tax=Paraburkholderia gardini TaxID=2823469 RepID=A0ABN7QPQ3_9BURK|nr:hypothetical protein R54767_02268 [Paraburkholderia gardini]
MQVSVTDVGTDRLCSWNRIAGSLARLPGWLTAFLGQPVSPPATGNTVPVI